MSLFGIITLIAEDEDELIIIDYTGTDTLYQEQYLIYYYQALLVTRVSMEIMNICGVMEWFWKYALEM